MCYLRIDGLVEKQSMKKYNFIIVGFLCIYIALAAVFYISFQQEERKEDLEYKIEINEIMQGLEKANEFLGPDLHDKEYVKEVTFLSVEKSAETGEVKEFYRNQNGVNSLIKPMFVKEELLGYVRFDYTHEKKDYGMLWLIEGVLLFSGILTLGILLYIRNKVIVPFSVLSEMPYELSKGHLKGELKEEKSRFFGKFVWGISMLRDTLNSAKAKELKLEKDKKMLLLSLSHDIKIPLSTIKLYAKALREGVYETEEKQKAAAGQIEVHALEIETFVKEIVTASSEDILVIEVENSEFYLKDYIEKVKNTYAPKCSISMIDFSIGAYDNKLLKGDFDRAFEVMENLIENAFKYGDGKRISIEFYEEDYCQVIKVYNSGQSLAPAEMPHIFDSFYRGTNVENKSGNGLGLYISRQIMQKMEGEIFAKREEDGMSFGLVFTIL